MENKRTEMFGVANCKLDRKSKIIMFLEQARFWRANFIITTELRCIFIAQGRTRWHNRCGWTIANRTLTYCFYRSIKLDWFKFMIVKQTRWFVPTKFSVIQQFRIFQIMFQTMPSGDATGWNFNWTHFSFENCFLFLFQDWFYIFIDQLFAFACFESLVLSLEFEFLVF